MAAAVEGLSYFVLCMACFYFWYSTLQFDLIFKGKTRDTGTVFVSNMYSYVGYLPSENL